MIRTTAPTAGIPTTADKPGIHQVRTVAGPSTYDPDAHDVLQHVNLETAYAQVCRAAPGDVSRVMFEVCARRDRISAGVESSYLSPGSDTGRSTAGD